MVVGSRFQVKRIVVHPGAALSLQSHHRPGQRHWIVVEGTARVTIDDKVRLVTESSSVYIPLGAVHRMENPRKGADGADRGADRQLSGRGRHHPLRGCLFARARGKRLMSALTCFKTYDIRGRLGVDLDEGIAYRIGRGFARALQARRVVLGHDARLVRDPRGGSCPGPEGRGMRRARPRPFGPRRCIRDHAFRCRWRNLRHGLA